MEASQTFRGGMKRSRNEDPDNDNTSTIIDLAETGKEAITANTPRHKLPSGHTPTTDSALTSAHPQSDWKAILTALDDQSTDVLRTMLHDRKHLDLILREYGNEHKKESASASVQDMTSGTQGRLAKRSFMAGLILLDTIKPSEHTLKYENISALATRTRPGTFNEAFTKLVMSTMYPVSTEDYTVDPFGKNLTEDRLTVEPPRKRSRSQSRSRSTSSSRLTGEKSLRDLSTQHEDCPPGSLAESFAIKMKLTRAELREEAKSIPGITAAIDQMKGHNRGGYSSRLPHFRKMWVEETKREMLAVLHHRPGTEMDDLARNKSLGTYADNGKRSDVWWEFVECDGDSSLSPLSLGKVDTATVTATDLE